MLIAQTSTTTGTGFKLIDAKGGGTSVFSVRGDGRTTIPTGGLSVVDGGTTVGSVGAGITALVAFPTHATYTGTAMMVKANPVAGTGFYLIKVGRLEYSLYIFFRALFVTDSFLSPFPG